MDFLNLAVILGGLALALHELHPLWKDRKKRDKEWYSGLLWGIVGLGVAIIAGITGIQSAFDSADAEVRIAAAEKLTEKARGEIEGERRARSELVEALRARNAPQFMNLREFEGTKVIFVCENDPESLLFTHRLGCELEMQGWRIVDAEIRERMDSGVSVTPMGGPSILFPDAKYEPAEKARDALVSELEDGGIEVLPGGAMGELPPNTVKVFVGPSPELRSPTKVFQEDWFRDRMGVKSVEEYVRPVFKSWQKGENAFIKWREQPIESANPKANESK